jgi:triphosphatase
VAVRRLRSAISSLKKFLPEEQHRWVTDELRWLGGALATARNLDVFAMELVPAARARMPEELGWNDLAATLDRLRQGAYEDTRKAVLSERYTAAVLRLLQWFEGCGWRGASPPDECSATASPICETASSVLQHRRRKVRQRAKGFGRLTPPERHQLRIAVKKLRYTIELFGSLFDDHDLERFVRRLRRLQNDLGYANDVRVAHEYVIEILSQIEPRSPAARAWVAALELHDQMLASTERKVRKHLDRLNEAPAFWQS